MNIPEDPIIARLRGEAMAERSAVSVELHRQVITNVYAHHRRQNRFAGWQVKAAAVFLVVVSVSALMMLRPKHAPIPPVVLTNHTPLPNSLLPAANTTSNTSVNINNILIATVWPPRVRISLPVDAFATNAEVQALPRNAPSWRVGSPQWLLAGIQEPTDSAQTAMADLIPPNLRALAGLLKQER